MVHLQRIVVTVALGLLVIPSVAPAAQRRIHGFIEPMPTAKLQQLFPTAATFEPRAGEPPHFTVYAPARPGTTARQVMGYAWWTIDVVPTMLGYDGHIHMLIGMDMTGRLTGVIMDLNNEPYGEFSIDRPEFAAQFKGKSIRDQFALGRDIDRVSRATISVRSAAETIQESARLVAAAVRMPAAPR